jgi:hypothetical protein
VPAVRQHLVHQTLGCATPLHDVGEAQRTPTNRLPLWSTRALASRSCPITARLCTTNHPCPISTRPNRRYPRRHQHQHQHPSCRNPRPNRRWCM